MSNNFVNCPHCSTTIEVLQLNCKIFRCGIYKESLEQINPHMCKEECDRLFNNNLIYGCGRPFRVEVINNEYKSTICDYI